LNRVWDRRRQTKGSDSSNLITGDAVFLVPIRGGQPRLAHMLAQRLPRNLSGSRYQHHDVIPRGDAEEETAHHLRGDLSTFPGGLFQRMDRTRMAKDTVWNTKISECNRNRWISKCHSRKYCQGKGQKWQGTDD
jgi:hypothetical protein